MSKKNSKIVTKDKGRILYAINDARVTRTNRKDVEEFCRLDKLYKQKGLSNAGMKKRSRIMVRLTKAGILKQMSREALEEAALIMFKSFPWYKRVWLKIKFGIKIFRKRMSNFFSRKKGG